MRLLPAMLPPASSGTSRRAMSPRFSSHRAEPRCRPRRNGLVPDRLRHRGSGRLGRFRLRHGRYPCRLAHLGLQHLQHAPQLGGLEQSDGARFALAAQLQPKAGINLRQSEAVGKLGSWLRSIAEPSAGVTDIAPAVLAIAASRSNSTIAPPEISPAPVVPGRTCCRDNRSPVPAPPAPPGSLCLNRIVSTISS